MKPSLILLTLLFALTLKSDTVFSETAKPQEEIFSTKGTLTEVNPEEKFVRLKNEGGLELTFLVNATTQVRLSEKQELLTYLAVNDEVEMEYVYNENYEKVARTIQIKKEAGKKIAEEQPALPV